MTLDEPSTTWQEQQHQRILQQDPTAFAELCERALPHLVSFLQRLYTPSDTHQCEQVAIDSLLNYQARPAQYDPTQLALWPYLRMAAKGDMLNLIDKQNRQNQHLVPLDDPAVQQQLPWQDTIEEQFAFAEWLQQYTHYSPQEIMALLEAELNESDRQVLSLLMEGVRDTRHYAERLNITHLDVPAQQAEVKRVKDRLVKKLRRFSQKLS
jgi:DNA-directed RNA polymerase specialized sigma24 family protein